jgi:hypothetical protein
MPTIDFFDREVRSAQERFNQTFGRLAVCNIRTRQLVILSIVRLGTLARKINANDKDAVRDKIRTFMETKNRLQGYFNAAEIALTNPNIGGNHVECTDKEQTG